jgi:hypothetical protein
LFYAGCGLIAAACGVLLFHFSMWSSKRLLHGTATVFNGIRRKRGAGRDGRGAATEELYTSNE